MHQPEQVPAMSATQPHLFGLRHLSRVVEGCDPVRDAAPGVTTYDNRPADETPDFICPAGNRCGCSDSNDCTREQPHRGQCVAPAAVGSRLLDYPQVWAGD